MISASFTVVNPAVTEPSATKTVSEPPATKCISEPPAATAASESSEVLLDVDLSQNDVFCAVSGESLTDEAKFSIIQNRHPPENCPLPTKSYVDNRRKGGVSVRRLNRAWFDDFPFTAYSMHAKGIFCLACVLFPTAPTNPGARRAETLLEKPFTDRKAGKESLSLHADLQYHISSEAKLSEFIRVYKNPSARVDQILSTEAQQTVARNRKVLLSIVKCIELCARQGIALRGHRDDSTSTDLNQGNFRAVIQFRREVDQCLNSHLQSCPRNAIMISKTVQNELLQHMGDYVVKHLVTKVNNSDFLAVMADEVSDVSNKEQLGIAVRYVKENNVAEKLLIFVQVDDISQVLMCVKHSVAN